MRERRAANDRNGQVRPACIKLYRTKLTYRLYYMITKLNVVLKHIKKLSAFFFCVDRWALSVRVRPANLLMSTDIRFTINSDFARSFCVWVFAKCQDRFSYYIYCLTARPQQRSPLPFIDIYFIVCKKYKCGVVLCATHTWCGSHNRHIHSIQHNIKAEFEKL